MTSTRLAFVALLLLLLALPALGDEQIRAAQAALRARKIYFGSIDGRNSDEWSAALRRFQESEGFDATGSINQETLDALGIKGEAPDAGSAAARQRIYEFLQRYLQTREAGDLNAEMGFYADQVDHYDDGWVERSFIRKVRSREYAHWPQRKYVLLNRIASWEESRPRRVFLTFRYRLEATDRSTQRRAITEDNTFILAVLDGELRIVSMKAVE